jgi:hypothetical protein
MRVLALLLVTTLLLGFAASEPEVAPYDAVGLSVAEASPAAETQPTQKPGAKTKSVDDEIKALGLKPCSLSAAMGRWKKAEKNLKTWADGGTPDFAEAKTTGVTIAGMTKLIEWKKNKKREKDAAGFDAIVTSMESASRKLAEAAIAKDAEAVKTASGEVSRNCSDCHGRFNNK